MPPRKQLISNLHSFTSERLSGTRTAQPVRLLAAFDPESHKGADRIFLAHSYHYTTIPADRTTHDAVTELPELVRSSLSAHGIGLEADPDVAHRLEVEFAVAVHVHAADEGLQRLLAVRVERTRIASNLNVAGSTTCTVTSRQPFWLRN